MRGHRPHAVNGPGEGVGGVVRAAQRREDQEVRRLHGEGAMQERRVGRVEGGVGEVEPDRDGTHAQPRGAEDGPRFRRRVAEIEFHRFDARRAEAAQGRGEVFAALGGGVLGMLEEDGEFHGGLGNGTGD